MSRMKVEKMMGRRAKDVGKPPKQKARRTRARLPATADRGPYAKLGRLAAAGAAPLGLFVLVEGAANDPAWRIYDGGSGKLLTGSDTTYAAVASS